MRRWCATESSPRAAVPSQVASDGARVLLRHPAARPSERGQASVELVALLPLIAVCAFVAWQLAVVGWAAWSCAAPPRAAARAAAVSGAGEGEATARRLLPRPLRTGALIRARDDGTVSIRVAVPAVIGSGPLLHLSHRARFAPQR